MIEAVCHCGNVKLTTHSLPSTITSCNCSICNRLGALWAYYAPDEVTVNFDKHPSSPYIWGDKDLEFHHCTICGCTTHYITTEKCHEKRIAINARMLDPELIRSLSIRYFDGASSWKYLDKTPDSRV